MIAPLVALYLSVVADGPAPPLKPTSKWIVDFAPARCEARRNYGTDEQPLLLVLKSPPLGNAIQIAVIRVGRQTEMAEQLDGEVAFDDRPPLKTSFLTYTRKQQQRRIYLANLPMDDFAPAKVAKVLSIRASRTPSQQDPPAGSRLVSALKTYEINERLAVSGMATLIKVMEDCVADLRNVWNVTEGSGTSRLKQRVQGDLRGVIQSDDYPGVAIVKGQSGSVTLALLVDEKGRVADCTVIETSGAASLDAQSCAILTARARLTPAVGLDGKPAKGSFLQRITWRAM